MTNKLEEYARSIGIKLDSERGLRTFVGHMEAALARKEKYKDQVVYWEEYFKSLGGILISNPPLSGEGVMMARIFPVAHTDATIFPLAREMYSSVLRVYFAQELDKFTVEKGFWNEISQDGMVQQVFNSSKGEKGGEIPFAHLTTDYQGTFQFRFGEKVGSTPFLWPDMIAEPTFIFKEVPRDIDRVWRVCYKNKNNGHLRPVSYHIGKPNHVRVEKSRSYETES